MMPMITGRTRPPRRAVDADHHAGSHAVPIGTPRGSEHAQSREDRAPRLSPEGQTSRTASSRTKAKVRAVFVRSNPMRKGSHVAPTVAMEAPPQAGGVAVEHQPETARSAG